MSRASAIVGPGVRIVLTGASGLVGGAFARSLRGPGPAADIVQLGRDVLWPVDPDAIRRRIAAIGPSLIINAAADTDVEGAESAPERSSAANAALPAALAAAAADAGAAFLHFSSTGCYGAWKSEPYRETDPLRPTTVHHASKARGEEQALAAHPAPLILRLGWVFGGLPGQRKNFVHARLREARGKTEIGSDPSQIGTPVFADDIAAQALALCEAGVTGVFNCVGEGGSASRLDYVAAILAAAGLSTRLVPTTFTRRAPVSPNEAAVNAHLTEQGRNRMPPWRESLAAFVAGLNALGEG